MGVKRRFYHSLRFKLLLVSLTLLGIPWAGYRFIQETEQFLRVAQDQNLLATAGAVANVLQGQADLFHGYSNIGSRLPLRNIYVHPLRNAPAVDGYRDDWQQLADNFTRYQVTDGGLAAKLLLGEHGRHLYLLLDVMDRTVSYGPKGDHVDISLDSGNGKLLRYRVQADAPGWVVAKRLHQTRKGSRPGNAVPRLRGEWQETEQGYTLELRIARNLIHQHLSIGVRDADSNEQLQTARLFPVTALGLLVRPSLKLKQLVSTLAPSGTRLWITDHEGHVLAHSGELDDSAPLSTDQEQLPWLLQQLILQVLPQHADTTETLPEGRSRITQAPVSTALQGRSGTLRRRIPDQDSVVVSAAQPIRDARGIMGSVLVEQTTNAILSIQNLALQRLFMVTVVFFVVTGLGLLAFASLLTMRIRNLRDHIEQAVTQDGRIVAEVPVARSVDEIGDLSRSFGNVLTRLKDYNHYLEAMASRLSHELRTPLAVVQTSLGNAEQETTAEAQQRYLQRAHQGAERLDTILRRLREATRLEQSFQQAEMENIDLCNMLNYQVDNYRSVHPRVSFHLAACETGLTVMAAPDLLLQALDKLVSNALDFHQPGTPIGITVESTKDQLLIHIDNEGPALPGGVDLFQSMVSIRDGNSAEPHLGLGLYLVRLIAEFHHGYVRAANTGDGNVRFTLFLAR